MSKRAAFTLVELLVVISIIALLLSILIPALIKARESAKRVVCQSKVRNLLLGVKMYADDNGDNMPTWDVVPLDNGYTISAKTQLCTVDQFARINKKVMLGKLFPSYLNDGHIFYCPSDNGKSYATAFAGMLTKPLGTASGNYYLRGSLDRTYKNPANSLDCRYIKILQKYPRWIIISDVGWHRYSGWVGPRDINHRDKHDLPAYFSTGFADLHVGNYHPKNSRWYPLVSSGYWEAYGMDLMQEGLW